jgi:hypothetical protein
MNALNTMTPRSLSGPVGLPFKVVESSDLLSELRLRQRKPMARRYGPEGHSYTGRSYSNTADLAFVIPKGEWHPPC